MRKFKSLFGYRILTELMKIRVNNHYEMFCETDFAKTKSALSETVAVAVFYKPLQRCSCFIEKHEATLIFLK